MTETQTPYQVILSTMPTGLDRSILRALRFRQGRVNAISRTDLVMAVKMQGIDAQDRQIRDVLAVRKA